MRALISSLYCFGGCIISSKYRTGNTAECRFVSGGHLGYCSKKNPKQLAYQREK